MIVIIVLAIMLLLFLAFLAFAKMSSSRTLKTILDIELIPGDIDNVFESFNVGRGVDVVGLIGNDFLDKYGYVIDFNKHTIFHKWHGMSFKEAMTLIGIPFIVLWQNERKYIFIIDTGSNNSHISSRVLDTLEYDIDESRKFVTIGGGGSINAKGIVKAKFRYE